jgi:hypothetical protein
VLIYSKSLANHHKHLAAMFQTLTHISCLWMRASVPLLKHL